MDAGKLPIPSINIGTTEDDEQSGSSNLPFPKLEIPGGEIGGPLSGLNSHPSLKDSSAADSPFTTRPRSVGSGTNYNFLTPYQSASPIDDEFDTREVVYHDLQPLHGSHRGEDQGTVFDSKVTYLDKVERQRYQISVDNQGRILDADDNLFDTRNATLRPGKPAERAIYAMNKYGDIYLSNYSKKGVFHHSSFLAGRRGAAFGDIRIVEGRVTDVSRISGHYQPTSNQLAQFISQLDKLGVPRTYRIEDNDAELDDPSTA